MENSLFFNLLKVALGNAKKLFKEPTAGEWSGLFELAKRQTLIGICFSGIEKLPSEQRPPKELLIKWYVLTQQIENRNKLVTQHALEIGRELKSDGFDYCVLKGQGVAGYYDNPERRQSGDIDIWVHTPSGSRTSDRKKTIAFVRKKMPEIKARYHHVDYHERKDISIELHFIPTWFNNPFLNYRLQTWFEVQKNIQFSHFVNGLCQPTDVFNAFYLMLHIQKHILEEGIGLRQLMDYYYLLINSDIVSRKKDVQNLFSKFGVTRTAKAVMYVLKEVFGLADKYLMEEPDKAAGRFLLNEIMIAGNFAKYDYRFGDLSGETSGHLFLRKEKRMLRFFKMNPGEVLWSPFFAIYQRIWRYTKNYL